MADHSATSTVWVGVWSSFCYSVPCPETGTFPPGYLARLQPRNTSQDCVFRVLAVLPVQGSSLTCSLSAIKPLFPLLSSLGSVLVKGNSFPSTLESLSTLSLPLTPFPQNPQTHTYTYTHTHSLFEYKSQRNSKAFFFFFGHFAPSYPSPETVNP